MSNKMNIMKRTLLLLTLVLLIAVMSCDRRNSRSAQLKQAVSEFKTKQKTLQFNSYYPEHHTQIKIDSVISNTFKVSLNKFASTKNHIRLNETHKNSNNFQNYHRVFECDVTVSVLENIVLKERISVSSFPLKKSTEFWANATLEHVWVNQEQSNSKRLSLGISFINPQTSHFKLYEMQIDQNGNERFILIEDQT